MTATRRRKFSPEYLRGRFVGQRRHSAYPELARRAGRDVSVDFKAIRGYGINGLGVGASGLLCSMAANRNQT
jgi:hypothetical protein